MKETAQPSETHTVPTGAVEYLLLSTGGDDVSASAQAEITVSAHTRPLQMEECADSAALAASYRQDGFYVAEESNRIDGFPSPLDIAYIDFDGQLSTYRHY